MEENVLKRQKLQLQKIKMLAEETVGLQFFDHENHQALAIVLQITHDGVLISLDQRAQTKVAHNQLFLLLRKHLQNAFLQQTLQQKNEIHFIFEGSKYLVLNALNVALELHVDDKSVLRVSSLKTYTKIKESTYEALTEPQYYNMAEVNPTGTKEVKLQTLPAIQRQVRDQLKRKLKTLKKAYSKQQKLLPSAVELDDLKKNIRELSDKHDSESGVKINKLYIKRKKLEAGAKMSLAPKILQQINAVELDLKDSGTADFAMEKIPALKKKWDLQDAVKKTISGASTKLPWRTLQLSSGELFNIGRSSSENDALVKSSKSNDIWFHAIQVQGSHVILKRQKKDFPDAKIIRIGLILAIHFSKLSQTRSGEVYVTPREFLKKRRDDPPGFWHVLKAEHFQIKYTAEELETVLKN